MLSRVATVKAPRTHNRRGVTGSSGRRREGRESEPRRPNMSRRVFTSAVLLLVVVMMWCGIGGGAVASVAQSSEPNFQWTDIKEDDVNVDSLGGPGLLKVGSDVFAVAEAHCKKDQNTVFTGIASQLLTNTVDTKPEEVLKDAKEKTQFLEEGGSPEGKKRVDVSRPTAVADESNIYMLVGKHSHEAATCKAGTEKIKSGMLLVKGQVSDEGGNKIHWKTTDGVPCTLGDQHKSLIGLIGGGGSGVKMDDGTLAFPVEGTKKKEKDVKTVSLIMCSSDTKNWTLSKGMSADGCSDPSVLEWEKDKLMMMTACEDGRRRVYEIGDKGDSWTEALGTLSRVWGNKHEGNMKGVGSGFTTAKIDNRDVMLVTLPVYSKKTEGVSANGKGVLRLWLTDNTHIVDIGSVSGDEDVAASSLLYKSGDQGNKEEKLIALYEKKKGDGEKPSPGMFSVLLTEQLKRVKEVLATWNEVDDLVSKLCPSEGATEDASSGNACSNTVKITDGLVGFLSGNLSDGTWKDEYLGVNATANNKEGSASTENGVAFTGSGAWAEWPVGKQGENQLYHFANYNFTLVATVSVHGEPKGDNSIPLMGAKMNDDVKTVLLGLSYNGGGKWILLCDDGKNKEHSSPWEKKASEHVVILLRNGKQGSAYVDGQCVGNAQLALQDIEGSKEISHFYIGGDGGSAGSREGVSVTVSNVLLYNRPLDEEEVGALNPNKAPIPPVVPGIAQGTLSQSSPDGQPPSGPKLLNGNEGVGGGSASTSAPSIVKTSTGKEQSAIQLSSGIFSGGKKNVDGGSSSDDGPTVVTVGGDKMRGNGSPQTPEVGVSSGGHGETAEVTDAQGEEGIHSQDGEVNATALNSSLGKLSQGNNSDAGTMRESGLPSLLLLLLGLWGFAAL
ncbi:trans-sialidase [Trypanosoma cruzi Dm28c]|uniref:Trans-sialidase n=2 Tax=Trypanosoma cruzi TaxID=5693 RepID=V5BC78_TRYCR|nr:trans-sialidase [Trypanosoma cruzi Dm28c]PWV00981.1 putative trans-sialidase, Group V [Trypanosoma cruzi]